MASLRPIAACVLIAVVATACSGTAAPATSGSAAGAAATLAPTPVPTPSPSPTASPTPSPSPTPVPTPTPVPLPLKFTKWTKIVQQGRRASATIETVKGATCEIVVTYSTVVSGAKGLTKKTADQNGVAIWAWTVGSSTQTGTWPIEVTCKANGRVGVESVDFAVVP